MTLTWGVNTLVGEKVVVCTLNKEILYCKLLHDGSRHSKTKRKGGRGVHLLMVSLPSLQNRLQVTLGKTILRAGYDPATFRVLGERDNHYTTRAGFHFEIFVLDGHLIWREIFWFEHRHASRSFPVAPIFW
jgi:hypothetical protein